MTVMATASSDSRLRRTLEFLGLQKSTIAVLGMVVLVGMGERMSERFLPVYMLALGGGAISIGLLNGLDNLLSALYSFPGGYLSDRIGVKRALLLFNFVAMAGFIIVIVIPSWPAVILGSVFFISWSSISLPATMGLIARVLPSAKRTMGVSMHAIVTRIPMALGPLLGGFCIAAWGERDGVRAAFGFALAFAVAGLVPAFILRGLKEFGEPTRKALIVDLSPEGRKAGMFGLYYLLRDIVVSIAAFGGAFLWEISPQVNFIGAFLFGLIGTVLFAVRGSAEGPTRPASG